jgi:hypothetical protein
MKEPPEHQHGLEDLFENSSSEFEAKLRASSPDLSFSSPLSASAQSKQSKNAQSSRSKIR